MGEPIRLWRGDAEVTVNGRAEADALVAKGWAVGPRPAPVEPVKAAAVLAAAQEEAPTPAPKVPPKRAGEYGSHAGTQTNVVDNTKQAEVKAEKAEKAEGKAGK